MKYFLKSFFNNLKRQIYIRKRLVSFEKCFKNNSFWINQKICTFLIIHKFSQFEKATNFQKFIEKKVSFLDFFVPMQTFLQ
jgi:hypothetical protein